MLRLGALAVVLAAIAALGFGLVRCGAEHERGKSTLVVSEAKAEAAKTAAAVAHVALDLADETPRRVRAAQAAAERGAEEIHNAVSREDFAGLYAAWAGARERVWLDAGLLPEPEPGAVPDPGAGGAARPVRNRLDA